MYFEKENIRTFDSKGELLITIMSSLAQEESRSISENVTWGHRKRIRYEALSARFQETKDKYDAVTAEIAQRGIRRWEFGPLAGSPAGDGDRVQRGALGQSGGSCDSA